MAKITYIVKVLVDDRVLSSESIEASDKILSLKRERGFQMEHSISAIAQRVVAKAIQAYDEEHETTNN